MIGLQTPNSKTSSKELSGENEVAKIETEPEIRAQVKEYLQRKGYQVKEQSRLTGKSGIEHVFDMLVERDDGLITDAVFAQECGAVFTAGSIILDQGLHFN